MLQALAYTHDFWMIAGNLLMAESWHLQNVGIALSYLFFWINKYIKEAYVM
mgnify:CR=1 FL=1